MRKKLDTRFPAARIKKIMQTDEEIGKIAMAVPLLVSKALELFLQDLCDRTYEMTVKKGAKTVNSLHLKQCVQSFNMFDFLKDTVSRVPDLGGSDAPSEDKSTIKRRKNSDDEELVNDDESKRARLNETGQASSTGRSRGRGRGRGRGRRSGIGRELTDQHVKSEDLPEMHLQNGKAKDEHEDRSYNVADVTELGTTEAKGAARTVRDFDLNMDLDENGEYVPTFEEEATIESLPNSSHDDKKHEDISGLSLGEMENIAMQPSHDDMKHMDISGSSLGEMENMAMHHPIPLAGFNGVMDEEYEDYDEED